MNWNKQIMETAIEELVEAGWTLRGSIYTSGRGQFEAMGSCYATVVSPAGEALELRAGNHSSAPTNQALECGGDMVAKAAGYLQAMEEAKQKFLHEQTALSQRESDRLAFWSTLTEEERVHIRKISGVPVGRAGATYIQPNGFRADRFRVAIDRHMKRS